MINLAVPAGDACEGVEVLRLHGDLEPSSDTCSLLRGRTRGIAGHVDLHDRAVEALVDEGAGGADLVCMSSQLVMAAAYVRRGTLGGGFFQQGILKQRSKLHAP
jgi:hypothetical protein